MRTMPLVIAIFFSLLATLPLNAGIVERDFVTPGDGLLTYDEVNQREWLDLTYTYGMELSTIQSRMEPGEVLEDFNFAIEEDVRVLNISAGPSPYSQSGVDELIDLLEPVFRGTGGLLGIAEYTLGQVAVGFENGEPRFDDKNVVLLNVGGTLIPGGLNRSLLPPSGRDFIISNPSDFEGVNIGLPNNFFAGQLASNDQGPFWLFRPAATPEPSSIVLLAIGAIAIFPQRRSR